jgi:hypothetical protein
MWGRDKKEEDKIPEKYRGKTTEEIVAMLAASEATAGEVANLKAALAEKDSAISEANGSIQELRQSVQSLEANRRPNPTVDPNANRNQVPDFALDPEGHIQAKLNEAFVPVANTAMMANANVAREQCRRNLISQKIPGKNVSKAAAFDRFSGEIDAIAKGVQLMNLQQASQWEWIFNQVLMTKMNDILGDQKGEMFSEPGVSGVASSMSGEKKPEQLTDEELRIAKRMGVTPENYAKYKKDLVAA